MPFLYQIRIKFAKIAKECIGYFSYHLNLYRYSSMRYRNEFFSDNDDLFQNNNNQKIKYTVDKILYCFWTGDNPFTPNRKYSFKKMKENSKVEVRLITPDNLQNYILKDFPLHKAYNYLSLVHKSDYLRCYFMHHYGGGYCDIKVLDYQINDLFDELSSRDDKWLLGYREVAQWGVADLDGKIGRDLKIHYRLLLGNGAYICKPHTPFTYEWYAEVEKRLDIYFDQLKANPGNIWGDNDGYPIPWIGILGAIFHPLCLKYSSKLLFNDKIKPSVKSYR